MSSLLGDTSRNLDGIISINFKHFKRVLRSNASEIVSSPTGAETLAFVCKVWNFIVITCSFQGQHHGIVDVHRNDDQW